MRDFIKTSLVCCIVLLFLSISNCTQISQKINFGGGS